MCGGGGGGGEEEECERENGDEDEDEKECGNGVWGIVVVVLWNCGHCVCCIVSVMCCFTLFLVSMMCFSISNFGSMD